MDQRVKSGSIGPWPLPRPSHAQGKVALWWTEGIETQAAAALVSGMLSCAPVPLFPSPHPAALGPFDAGREGFEFRPTQPWDQPGGWGPAWACAAAAGCQTLLIPVYRDTQTASPACHWHHVSRVLADMGGALWLPFLHMKVAEVKRLAGYLGVPKAR